jgi:O-antigen/teichoic acid export membrane protein
MLKARIRAIMARNHAAVSFLDQAIISSGNFFSGIIAARALGPIDFGLYFIATMIIMEVASVQNALTLQPMIVNGASLSDRDFARFFGAQVIIQAGMVVAGALIVLAIALAWEPLRPVAIPLMLASAAWQTQEFCRRVLYTRGEVVEAAINNAVSFDLQALAFGVMAWNGSMEIESALWVVAGTSMLGVLVGLWQLRGYVSGERDDVRATARESFRLGRWIAGSYALSVASLGAYPALLTALSGLTSTAGFGIVKQVLGPLHLMTRPLDNFFLPRATRALNQDGTSAMQQVLWQATRLIAPIFLVYGAVLLFGAELIIGLVYGEDYVEHAAALRLYAVAVVIWLPVCVLRLEIAARKLQRFLLWGEVWSVVVVYGVGLFLISSYGLLGAAIAHLIVNVGTLVLTVAAVYRERTRASRATPALQGYGDATQAE